MRTSLFAVLILFLVSCQSETDKLIKTFESKVDDYETLVMEDIEKNEKEIQAKSVEINGVMDALGTRELSDSQQSKVTGIALRYQISLAMVQEEIREKMNVDLDAIQKSLDSLDLEIEQIDNSLIK